MSVTFEAAQLNLLNMRARMPFKYGIATMTAAPHLFMTIHADFDGVKARGVAADFLPPKWFTKDPAKRLETEVAEMLDVIEAALRHAEEVGRAASVFDFWQAVYDKQKSWAQSTDYPPLLWNFGVTLVERALISACCTALDTPFGQAVRDDRLGLRLGDIHPELAGSYAADFLPRQPRRTLIARHTVGLGDYLTDSEVPDDERVDDGLPQSLEACIRAYGLTHYKIKLHAQVDVAIPRLRAISKIIAAGGRDFAFTLDGNEAFETVDAFADLWPQLQQQADLKPFLKHLIFVEQPLHRSVALSDDVGTALRNWKGCPPIIIDESDASLDSAKRALDLGYVGTSHKNCKGIFKSIANCCMLEKRRQEQPEATIIMSAEDLANVGPVALNEDLAVVANLGIDHVERNGHHYFKGLTALPDDMQADALAAHGDLYRRHEAGVVTLDIKAGRLDVASVIRAPFGVGYDFDAARFPSRADWQFDAGA